MAVSFGISSVCSAFAEKTIGSKVTSRYKTEGTEGFESFLTEALEKYDPSGDRVKGQHFIVLPKEAYITVSAGDGVSSPDPEAYVNRNHRGKVEPFLRRELAGEVNFLAVVVNTREAYFADPEVDASEDVGDCTHVIVAVIASSGPEAPLTEHRFVANLAGGNKEALKWSADEIRAKAREIKSYWAKHSVVAD